MDTEGPVSVLDRRPRSSSRDRVIADRITRQRSPGPSFRRHRGQGVPSKTGSDEDDQEEVIYRISQPYRTSFSAKHSVTWGKVDRSRSLSPTSSLRSNLSINSIPPMLKTGGDKRRPRGQSKSPKRVTYNTRVTVRTSDTEDSVFTELSSYEYDDEDVSLQPNMSPFSRSIISPKYNEFSQLSPFPDTKQPSVQHPEHRQHVKDITNLSYSSVTDQSHTSRDSGLDYSAELRDLSDQISNMNWTLKHSRNAQDLPKQVPSPTEHHYIQKHPSSIPSPSAPSPPGILKPSSDFHGNIRDRDRNDVFTKAGYEIFREGVTAGYSTQSSRSGQSWPEDELDNKLPKMFSPENGSAAHPFTPDDVDTTPDTEGQESPILDSDHLSHKDDVVSSSPTDTSQGDASPGRGSPIESGRLTPSKRSVSLSITNFLKRVSPHFRRKRSKDRNKKSSSAESSAQSLANTSDADTDQDLAISAGDNKKTKRPGRFSRNRVRQSFLKLVGGSSSKNKNKKKTQAESSHYTIEPQDPDKQTSSEDMDDIANGFISKSNEDIGTDLGKSCDAPVQTMRSSTLNNGTLHDAHPFFRDENVHHDTRYVTESTGLSLGHDVHSYESSLADTVYSSTNESTTPVNGRMDFFTESDINAILRPHLGKPAVKTAHLESNGRYDYKGVSLQRSAPPTSLDVMPARTKRLMQTSMMSSISGDESIGDCSLDANLTASEPSLLSGISQSGGSRQVVIPNSLVNSVEGRIPSEGESSSLIRTTTRKEEVVAKDSVPQGISPKSRSDPSSPVDPSHKPSYLKLSCAVSGYGRYCSYSMYKDGAKRSPCSSQSSLRSDMSSPDPSLSAGHMTGEEFTSESKNTQKPLVWSRFEKKQSNQATSPVVAMNGHVLSYPTGDTKKDGEYFLQHMRFEEDRIKGFCTQAEVYIRSHDLPEEASGRVRAAIGKANLLVTQKFVQFRDLCHNHMQRSPDERETKWEDLQGFWDIVRIQIDNVDEMFAEIELMKQNGWQEVPEMASKHSSANSSPRSGNVSQNSTPAVTPSHTPGSKRRNLKQNRSKDTPDSSPEEAQKTHLAVRARDEARKKLLSEKRAAMKQASAAAGNGTEPEVEIFLQEPPHK